MEKIVEQVLEGKKGAATKLYYKYSPDIRKYLVSKLPAEQDVQEVLQEVFLSVFDSLPIFSGKSSLKTWIYSIARHEVADFYRKRYVRKAVEVTTQLYEGVAIEISTPEKDLKKSIIKDKYNRAMEQISSRYREVLIYKYEMDLPVKEMARRMNLSFKATESLLYRARMAFITVYDEVGERIS